MSSEKSKNQQNEKIRFTIPPLNQMEIIDNIWFQRNLETGESKMVVSGPAVEMFPHLEEFNPDKPGLISY